MGVGDWKRKGPDFTGSALFLKREPWGLLSRGVIIPSFMQQTFAGASQEPGPALNGLQGDVSTEAVVRGRMAGDRCEGPLRSPHHG